MRKNENVIIYIHKKGDTEDPKSGPHLEVIKHNFRNQVYQ